MVKLSSFFLDFLHPINYILSTSQFSEDTCRKTGIELFSVYEVLNDSSQNFLTSNNGG